MHFQVLLCHLAFHTSTILVWRNFCAILWESMCVDIHMYVADPPYMLYWYTGGSWYVYICVHEYDVAIPHRSLFLPLHPSPPSTSYLYPDASLTVSNIYQATSTVDYGSLNDCLEVPDSVFFQINVNPSYPTEEKKREAIITYFLNTVPLASWATLAGKLHYQEEHVSLEAVRKYLHHTTG